MQLRIMVTSEKSRTYKSKKTGADVESYQLNVVDVDSIKTARCGNKFTYQPTELELGAVGKGNFTDNKYDLHVTNLRQNDFSDEIELQGLLVLSVQKKVA